MMYVNECLGANVIDDVGSTHVSRMLLKFTEKDYTWNVHSSWVRRSISFLFFFYLLHFLLNVQCWGIFPLFFIRDANITKIGYLSGEEVPMVRPCFWEGQGLACRFHTLSLTHAISGSWFFGETIFLRL